MRCALSDDALDRLLREEAPCGDLTTYTLEIGHAAGHVTFAARQPMTVCGSEEAVRLFELAGAEAQLLAPSGGHVLAGAELLTAHGPAASLLLAWPVAQNLVEAASGIASEAARMVTELRAAGHVQPLACTGRSFPGAWALSVKAVFSGGAIMHRLNLSDSLLLLPEHRLFVGADLDDYLNRVLRNQPARRLVAQVDSLADALTLAHAGADVLQLDGFTPEAVVQCRVALREIGQDPLLAVGEVHAANAVAYAEAGADILLSSAPYRALPCEVEVRISPAV